MPKLPTYALLIALALLPMLSFAQKTTEEKVQAIWEFEEIDVIRREQTAANMYEAGNYLNAIYYYESVIPYRSGDEKILLRLGESNFQVRDYRAAISWFEQLQHIAPDKYALAQFHYALALKSIGKYDQSIVAFKKAKQLADESKKPEFDVMLIPNLVQGCELGKQLKGQPNEKFKVNNMGDLINAPLTEYAPLPLGNSMLFYSAVLSDTMIEMDDKWNSYTTSKIYYTSRHEGHWHESLELPASINDPAFHIGNGSFNEDHTNFYYSKCDFNKKGVMHCEIYKVSYQNGSWGEPEALSSVNQEGSNATHPAVGRNAEGEDVLYFSSDREGGKGGMDIWLASLDESGDASGVENAGGFVNTLGDEVTPFYHFGTDRFFFSSDGHVGIGGKDIYWMSMGKETVNHLAPPINTSYDDRDYVLTDDGHTGYLVSNRPGLYNLKASTCCDDIYEVSYRHIDLGVRGNVSQDLGFQQEAAKNVSLSLYANGDSLVGSKQLNNDAGGFFFQLQEDKSYKLLAEKDGFYSKEVEFNTLSSSRSDTIQLDKIILKLKNPKNGFYYDAFRILTDEIKCTAYNINLTNSLFSYLASHPEVHVRLEGHIGDGGEDSEAKTKLMYDYMLEQGIAPGRLSYKSGNASPLSLEQINAYMTNDRIEVWLTPAEGN